MPIRRRRRPPPQRGPAPLPWERGGTTSRGRGPGPRRPRLCPPARRHPRRGQRGSRRPAGTAGGAAVRPVSPPAACGPQSGPSASFRCYASTLLPPRHPCSTPSSALPGMPLRAL